MKNVILNSNTGQVLLILLLVMTVALTIGLSVVQQSLTDVSTASKIEQSTRAFSAAEAGIEKALSAPGTAVSPENLGNNAKIEGVNSKSIPGSGLALEYSTLRKDEMAQVWLANPNSVDLTPFYDGNINILWGNTTFTAGDEPAIAITVIYESITGEYKSKKYFFDPVARNNGFEPIICGVSEYKAISDQSPDPGRSYYCRKEIAKSSIDDLQNLILLRVRLLYTQSEHPVAVAPVGVGVSLPPDQGRIFTSTGVSGETERKVQLIKEDNVVPFYFDYAIFAADAIEKAENQP